MYLGFTGTYCYFLRVKAKQMPVTASKLRRLLKSKHPYVERNLGSVVTIIRHSMQNAIVFEEAAQQLRMGRVLNVRVITLK